MHEVIRRASRNVAAMHAHLDQIEAELATAKPEELEGCLRVRMDELDTKTLELLQALAGYAVARLTVLEADRVLAKVSR